MARATAPTWDTQVLTAFVDEPRRGEPNEATLACAQRWLERGVPVVIPTETVYGLAAPARDREAVSAVFAIKDRPLDNPLIVHVTGQTHLDALELDWSPLAARLAEAFWPGPLTLVVSTRARWPWVTAGLDSMAIRAPAHAFAAALIDRAGPLAAPSANLSGKPSPTRAEHAAQDLRGRVPLVVDAGELEHGLESTVVDARGARPVLLRPGALPLEAIEDLCGSAPAGADEPHARSPGMKYRHYSPRAEVWLYPPLAATLGREALGEHARELRRHGRRVAVIAREAVVADRFVPLPHDPRETARLLFAWLRELDALEMDHVLVEGVAPTGLGRAIMDRLARAATRVVTNPSRALERSAER